MRRSIVVLVAAAAAATAAGKADALMPARRKNCTIVHLRYPHGIGRVGGHDRTTGEPVTNFKRSNRLYALAMRYNSGLGRDKDGIACEKH